MLHQSIAHAWPPFVLVSGLLLIGAVAHRDGQFARAGQALERLPGPPVVLFACGALVVTAVTAVLNLDTAVVFLTPVLLLSARHRGADEQAFLYMPVFTANAGSLFLPGSNLTNLIVLADTRWPAGISPVSSSRPPRPRPRPRSWACCCCSRAGCGTGHRRTAVRPTAPGWGPAWRPQSSRPS